MSNIQKLILVLFALGVVGYYFYTSPKFTPGSTAPLFESVLLDGSDFRLSSLKGNYVLLDFWGSWCPPCIQENKELVELYDQYNNRKYTNAQDFFIISIGIESNAISWQKRIEMDNLTWKYHIIQTQKFRSPIAQLYGIKEIPTKYLLDPNGKIIGVNQSVEQIGAFLQKYIL